MELQDGFYYVTYLTEHTIARYNEREQQWYLTGSNEPYNGDEFDSVGAFIPLPGDNVPMVGVVELGTGMHSAERRPIKVALPVLKWESIGDGKSIVNYRRYQFMHDEATDKYFINLIAVDDSMAERYQNITKETFDNCMLWLTTTLMLPVDPLQSITQIYPGGVEIIPAAHG